MSFHPNDTDSDKEDLKSTFVYDPLERKNKNEPIMPRDPLNIIEK